MRRDGSLQGRAQQGMGERASEAECEIVHPKVVVKVAVVVTVAWAA